MQWWFKKFCKGDESLEDEECSVWPSEVDDNWEPASKRILLQHRRSCQRTQCWPFYGCSAFEANWKGVKAQWVSAAWAHQKKKKSFLCVLLYATTTNHFSIVLWHEIQLSGWTKKKLQRTSQSQIWTPKEGQCHCLVDCSPSDPLQISESQRKHYIW